MTCQKQDITNFHKILTDLLDGKLPKFMKYPEGFSGWKSSRPMPEPASLVVGGAEQTDNTVPHAPAAADTSVEEACAATTVRDTMEPASSTIVQSKLQATASSKEPPKPPEEASTCSRQQSNTPSALPTASND